MNARIAVAVGLLVTIGAAPAVVAEPQEIDVYLSGHDGYHTYRIPSVIVTTKGTVLAFCEGRKKSSSDTGKIDLLLKRSSDGGKTFAKQQIVWDDRQNTCGNPCPVVDRQSGTIFLLLTHNLGSDAEAQIIAGTSKASRTVWVTHSSDDGLTWSSPKEITAGVKKPDWTWYATGPGAGIQLTSGRLLVPCDHHGPKFLSSHVIYSGGSAGPLTNECEVLERADGSLLLSMRNYDRTHRARAVASSLDGGLSWSKPSHDEALIEPVCQASLRRYSLAKDGGRDRLLFCNPARTDKRENMTLRMSYDEGRTWPLGRVLWPGPAAYSCLAVLGGGTILCLYERGEKHPYEKITLARVSLDWLEGGVHGSGRQTTE
jgi:sialidase-1